MVSPMKPESNLPENSTLQPLETLKETQEVESPTKTKLTQDRLTTIPNHIRQLNISKPDQDSASVVSMKQIREQTSLDEFGFRENKLEPMRPLIRGYCSTLTLQGRQKGLYGNQLEGDYCEISMANG